MCSDSVKRYEPRHVWRAVSLVAPLVKLQTAQRTRHHMGISCCSYRCVESAWHTRRALYHPIVHAGLLRSVRGGLEEGLSWRLHF